MSAPRAARKPPHAFAVVIFTAALLFVMCELGFGYGAYLDFIRGDAASPHLLALFRWNLYALVRGAFQSGLEMMAAGFLIALLDRIRWLLTPDAERAELAGRYLVSRLGRALTRRSKIGAG